MAQRRKSFGSKTLIALVLISVVGFTLPAVTAHAEDCLAAPNSPAREGTRWYYRLDQATQHKCWYTRALDQSTQQAATSVKTTLPAPAFAIPIPRPRPSTADSALSLNPGDTDLSSSHAEEIVPSQALRPPAVCQPARLRRQFQRYSLRSKQAYHRLHQRQTLCHKPAQQQTKPISRFRRSIKQRHRWKLT